jgi:transcriptional regulator with XRE-family HTH domain
MKKQPKNRIAEERKAKGMTQQDLADAVGSHWITISKLERGRIKLTTEWLEKLATPLGVPPGALLRRAEIRSGFADIPRLFHDLPSKALSDPKKFPSGKGQVQLKIDRASFEPLLRTGDTLTLTPWAGLNAQQRAHAEGRLCFFDGGAKSSLGFLYAGRKANTYDLFWLGGRAVEGAKATNIFLTATISFQEIIARP